MSSVCIWTCPAQRLMFGVQQKDCSTNAVPGRRNCGRRSSSWCGEQPVDRSQQTGDVGRRQLALAGSTTGGILGPCRADTCTPELLSWRRSAVVLVASEDHRESNSYAPIFWLLSPDERQHSNAAIHITMHNTQRQSCFSTADSEPTSHLICGHKKIRGRRHYTITITCITKW